MNKVFSGSKRQAAKNCVNACLSPCNRCLKGEHDSGVHGGTLSNPDSSEFAEAVK